MGETPSNRVYSLRVRVSDGLDLYDQTRQFVSPPSDPQMQFFVDVAGDGAFELAGGGQNYIEFNVEPGVGQTVISGFVRHPNGAHADFDELVLLSNSTPELAEARVITVDSEAFEVVLATSAVDSDDDDIIYEIDWGDGNQTTTSANIISHQYPAVFSSYVIRVAVRWTRRPRLPNVSFEFSELEAHSARNGLCNAPRPNRLRRDRRSCGDRC